MSRTHKEGKRKRQPRVKATAEVMDAIVARHVFGRSEKILRRNRKTWTRLANKRRRVQSKVEITRSDTRV